jgi:hypothetical protein
VVEIEVGAPQLHTGHCVQGLRTKCKFCRACLRVGCSPAVSAAPLGATAWMSAPWFTFSARATWSVAICRV